MPNKIKKNYTENQWQHFLWSDDILKPLAQIIVSKYRGSQENTPVRSSVKHGGGSVMVWGCICICAVGNLAKTDGIMNAKKYHQILIQNSIISGKRLIGNSFIFTLVPKTLPV